MTVDSKQCGGAVKHPIILQILTMKEKPLKSTVYVFAILT